MLGDKGVANCLMFDGNFFERSICPCISLSTKENRKKLRNIELILNALMFF